MQESNREPRLTDLRDSGDIEQDADRVLFIHRPDEDPLNGRNQAKNEDAEDRPQDFVNIIQGKGRNVGQGQIVSFYFKRTTATFTPATRKPIKPNAKEGQF
jgi:replicative DNA helicase